jgi:hypothetical protein
MSNTSFLVSIAAMNAMYKLPVSESLTAFPGEPMQVRLEKFQRTLAKELAEGRDIEDSVTHCFGTDLDHLAGVADWLGDIVVYCYSEAAKYGIPLDVVLAIIMRSNETKLGADGKPIYDADGKFCKGPNYVAPEPEIRVLLESLLARGNSNAG